MSWTHLEFGGPEARLGRFNFHRERTTFAPGVSAGKGAVGMLSADVREAGRGYFLDALAIHQRHEELVRWFYKDERLYVKMGMEIAVLDFSGEDFIYG